MSQLLYIVTHARNIRDAAKTTATCSAGGCVQTARFPAFDAGTDRVAAVAVTAVTAVAATDGLGPIGPHGGVVGLVDVATVVTAGTYCAVWYGSTCDRAGTWNLWSGGAAGGG